MTNWAGGKILNGRIYWWINYSIGNKSIAVCEDYFVPKEWLLELYDDKLSGELMPAPVEIWN